MFKDRECKRHITINNKETVEFLTTRESEVIIVGRTDGSEKSVEMIFDFLMFSFKGQYLIKYLFPILVVNMFLYAMNLLLYVTNAASVVT